MPVDILIVEDERAIREELADFLHEQGYACVLASTGQDALTQVHDRDFDVILLDVRLPDMSGVDVLARLREVTPDSHAFIMTAHPSVETVVSALRLGAVDYVTKPLILEDLLQKIRRSIQLRAQELEIRWYRQQVQRGHEFSNIVGKSGAMKEVFELVRRVASTDSPVLVTGESGTGKELIASAIHHNGARADGRFVAVNCSAIPATLLESEMFGHVKGAFTGAEARTSGFFFAANGGTLLLDEIGDLPLDLQPKLLRAVEQQSILPVGATQQIDVNVRIIASTNMHLKEAVQDGGFRADLYYRLAVVTIDLPALRDRVEDIPALVDRFIARNNKNLKKKFVGVTNDALRRLVRYSWPGNVRELQNVVERAMILEDGDVITTAGLPPNMRGASRQGATVGPLKDAVREFEQEYIGRILQATKGDKQLAADLLGVSVSSIYRRLHDIEKEADDSRDGPIDPNAGCDGEHQIRSDSVE